MNFEKHDYGPLRTYEVVWVSGHIDTVQGHQVHLGSSPALFGDRDGLPPRFSIHGEFDGHWRLVLSGLTADLVTVRDVTEAEQIL